VTVSLILDLENVSLTQTFAVLGFIFKTLKPQALGF